MATARAAAGTRGATAGEKLGGPSVHGAAAPPVALGVGNCIIDAQSIIRTVAVAAERMRRRSFQLAVESLLLSVAVAAERMRRHSCSERAGGSFQDPRTYLPFFVLWDTEKDSVVE